MPRPPTPTLTPYTEQLPDVNSPATWAVRTPLFWNWVTGPGYENISDAVTYSEDAIDYIDTALAGSETVVDAVAAMQAQLSGRNKIINGSGRINQRGYVSGTATSGANQFTLDRWFVVASGQNLTFTGNDSGRVMTAPAGGVAQVIEGANIVGGTYVLNWTGTATATVNGTARAKGATFTLTANTNVTVRFSSGTFADVQLESGTIATQFEFRPVGQELAMCQRYFFVTRSPIRIQDTANAVPSSRYSSMLFPTEMRATPTATSVFSNGVNNLVFIVTDIGPAGFSIKLDPIGTGEFAITYAAGNYFDAELTS